MKKSKITFKHVYLIYLAALASPSHFTYKNTRFHK